MYLSNLSDRGTLRGQLGAVSEIFDYNDAINRPVINGKEVEGSHDGHYYGLANMNDIPPATEVDVTSYQDGERIAAISVNGDSTDINIPKIEGSGSGAIVTVEDALDKPLESLVVDVRPVQASGTPTPESPIPITGWTGAKIHNFGLPNGYKAVDYVTLTAPIIYDGITDFNRNDLCIITEFKVETVSNYGAIYSAYSAEANNATRLIQNKTSPNELLVNNNSRASSTSKVEKSGGYIPNGFNKFISYHSSFDINGNTSSSSVASGNNNTATSLNICSSSNSVSFRRFDIQSWRTEGGETIYTPLCSLIPCTNSQGVGGFWDAIGEKFYTTSDPTNITATGTPNRGTEHIADVTYPISWQTEAGTVYGGYIDYERKKLVVNRAEYNITSTRTFTQNGEDIIAMSVTSEYRVDVIPQCECFEGITRGSSSGLAVNQCRLNVAMNAINFKFSAPKTVDEWEAELANNPIQLILGLVNPIEYDLDEPVPTITTLLGINNIWADCGNIELTYQRDLNLMLNMLWDAVFNQ